MVNTDDFLDLDYVLDQVFNVVQKAIDGNILYGLLIASFLGYAQRTGLLKRHDGISSLSPEERVSHIYRMMLKDADFSIRDANTGKVIPLNPNELQKYANKLSKDLKLDNKFANIFNQYNKTFRDAQKIADSIGMFGYVESNKLGQLNYYKSVLSSSEFEVRIPFESVGDRRVCATCRSLESGGPYLVEEYPPAPHYGCRCSPGKPEISKKTY